MTSLVTLLRIAPREGHEVRSEGARTEHNHPRWSGRRAHVVDWSPRDATIILVRHTGGRTLVRWQAGDGWNASMALQGQSCYGTMAQRWNLRSPPVHPRAPPIMVSPHSQQARRQRWSVFDTITRTTFDGLIAQVSRAYTGHVSVEPDAKNRRGTTFFDDQFASLQESVKLAELRDYRATANY